MSYLKSGRSGLWLGNFIGYEIRWCYSNFAWCYKGLGQTLNFSCPESNANMKSNKEINIRFGT
jgi:hypothetical protein